MTMRRHVLAGLQRVILIASVLALLIFALSGQDRSGSSSSPFNGYGSNSVAYYRQSINFEEEAGFSMEERLLEQDQLTATEVKLSRRRKFLMERCSEEGLDQLGNDSLHRPNAWEFLVNREHHLIWCNVFKAASTSWMYNFNLLAGYSRQFLKASKAVPVSLARQKYPRHTAEELFRFLNDSLSFIIVRHPFERLLSAYRDKLEHSLPHTFHSKLGSQIVAHYRVKSIKSGKHNPRYPLFEEFVKWLLCEWKSGNELDMHWTPIVTFCSPCQVRFDVIAKFETLHDDQNYLIKQAHVGHIIKPEWKNPTRGVQTKDVVKQYFSRLCKTEIKQLYEIFRYDFILFEYSLIEYLEYGRNEETKLICKKKDAS